MHIRIGMELTFDLFSSTIITNDSCLDCELMAMKQMLMTMNSYNEFSMS